MRRAIDALKRHLMEVADLESVSSLLEWDECVYMPAASARAHARQKATLTRLAHEKFTSPVIGRLLDELAVKAEALPYDSDDAALVRVADREYRRAVRVPLEFVTRLEEHKSRCHEAWCKAWEEDDFSPVAPLLKAGIDLSREYAAFFPGYQHVCDPLIDINDYGMKVSTLRAAFQKLRDGLIPLLRAIDSRPQPQDDFLFARYPRIKQLRFGQSVIERCGFDFLRGRQDLSLHPFTSNMSADDVRITTRVNEHSFFDSFSSTLHEAGHAMYEQGIPARFEGSPLGRGASLGMHEGQARLWENLVGRSERFWGYFFPVLKAIFPEQLTGVNAQDFYRAINKVQPSLRRMEADEVTYNLHVMIRFELELQLLEGTLEVEDLPQAWEESYAVGLGVIPSNVIDGVLQDVHWYCDLFGGSFQSYAIGNIISAACFASATRENPAVSSEMENGEFRSLLCWLNNSIYRHGSKFTASELVESLTGSPLPVGPYLDYLYGKYGQLYGLDTARPHNTMMGEQSCAT